MVFPSITSTYAALFALILVALSAWVVATRVGDDVLHGDGGNATLQHRIRIQANFTEYVPFALLLLALLEAGGASRALVQILCLVLLVGRVLHPVGMLAPKNSPQQYICRGGGIATTLAVISITALALLVHLA